ncbi:MAG: repeat-containing protein [Pseudonocardiales bacterium]|nr:repeat-containing protein [Pseudonocardiales bacterium]
MADEAAGNDSIDEPRPASAVKDFRSVHTASVPRLLRAMKGALLVTTYQSGRLVILRADDDGLNTHFVGFEAPMGIALTPGGFALGTKRQIYDMRNQPAVAAKMEPVGKYDAAYLPRSAHWTGDIRVHEMAYVKGELWFISTLFSCLATIDADHSFVPQWRPPFISALAPEDRCHLNGFALRDGEIRYATALGMTDEDRGWRANKLDGGILMEVPSGEVIAGGLCMPHSPRWYRGQLWILQSGNGTLGTVDLDTGQVTTVATLPGFTRGLAFAGQYAFVGLSQVRETVFEGLPIVERDDRACGVWVVDITTGTTVGYVKFEGDVQEIFDVTVVGHQFPEVVGGTDDLTLSSYVVPTQALAEVPPSRR